MNIKDLKVGTHQAHNRLRMLSYVWKHIFVWWRHKRRAFANDCKLLQAFAIPIWVGASKKKSMFVRVQYRIKYEFYIAFSGCLVGEDKTWNFQLQTFTNVCRSL